MLGFSPVSRYAISQIGPLRASLPDYPGTGYPPSYPVPLPDLPNERHHRIMLARSVALSMQGKTNNVIQSFTLAASTTQTTLSHPLVGGFSFVALMPTTANAAAENCWVTDFGIGTALVHHSSTGTTDRTFKVLVVG